MNIELMIEQLQENGKTDVTNFTTNQLFESRKQLEEKGYITWFKSSDRDYLILDERSKII